MKKVLYCALAAAGVMSMASCSNDDAPMPAGDGVNITVKLPRDMATRGTFGDGTDDGDRAILDNLQWSVFEVLPNGTLELVFSDGRTAFDASQTEELVSLPLAKGKTYQVAFYADDKDNAFVTYSDGNISVDYSKAASNTAAEDAFIGKSKVFTVTGAYSESVTLTRPFAQLNWGTDDTEAKVLNKVIQTLTAEVAVTKGLYTGMNVISGETIGEPVAAPVKFAAVEFTSLPNQTFPVKKDDPDAKPYLLIAMNYLLTGNGTIDCEMSFNNGLTPVTVNAAPVQVNHRTNIYGSLLTAPGEFNIKVDNNFLPEDNNLTSTPSEPKKDADGTYLIKTQGELAWIAEQVNGGDMLSGKTFSLQNDIYMVGKWTPIGGGGLGFNFRFCGKFLGNGHTIHNLIVDNPTADRVGFFGFMNGQIENLNFDNASVTGNHWAGVVAGYSDNETGSTYIKNCKVTNSSVKLVPGNENGDKGGLIIGYMAARDQVENCVVTNCTLQGYRDLGGIIGYSNYSVIRNNKVDGLKIIIDKSDNYKNYTELSKHDANGVIGEKVGGTDEGNTSANVQVGMLVSSQDALNATLKGLTANGTLDVYLSEGTFTLPSVTAPGAILNVIGAGKKTVVKTSQSAAGFKDLNFSNVTISGQGTYTGFQHLAGTTSFTDCDLTGTFCGYSPNLVFTRCNFTMDADAYSLWTYAAAKADFIDCNFTNTKSGKAILVYIEDANYAGIDIDVTGCTFTAPETGKMKGVVEIHTEMFTGNPRGTVAIKNSKYTGCFTGWVREVDNSQEDEPATDFWNVVIENS